MDRGEFASAPGSVPKLMFRVNEVVAATGIGRTTLYALIRDGKLKTKKLGARTLIARSELERMLSELPPGAPGDDLPR